MANPTGVEIAVDSREGSDLDHRENARATTYTENPADDMFPSTPQETAMEERMVNRLIPILTDMLRGRDRSVTNTTREEEPEENPTWDDSKRTDWKHSWSSSDKWKAGTDKDWETGDWYSRRKTGGDPRPERPFLSHIDFPKYDGRPDEFFGYQYAGGGAP